MQHAFMFILLEYLVIVWALELQFWCVTCFSHPTLFTVFVMENAPGQV